MAMYAISTERRGVLREEQAAFTVAAPDAPTLSDVSDQVLTAEGRFQTLLASGAGDEMLSAALERVAGLRETMAAWPAQTVKDLLAKLVALHGCLVRTDDGPEAIEGDCGLAVSLMRDAVRLLG